MSIAPAILIVRTVSVEKLSPVIEACAARWPGRAIHVASTPGRAGELRQDGRIHRVIEYTAETNGFDRPLTVEETVAALVIPVGNQHGCGYANVIRACNGIRAAERYLASHCSVLKRMSRLRWALKWRLERALALPACWVARWWAHRILDRNAA